MSEINSICTYVICMELSTYLNVVVSSELAVLALALIPNQYPGSYFHYILQWYDCKKKSARVKCLQIKHCQIGHELPNLPKISNTTVLYTTVRTFTHLYIRTYVCVRMDMYDGIGSDIDYDYEEYNVTFPAGFTRVSFDIMIINDDNNLTDKYELVNISISSISNGHVIGNPGVATVTITTTGEYCTNLFTYVMYVCRYIISFVYILT